MSGYAVPIYLPRRRRIVTPAEWLRERLAEQQRKREADVLATTALDQASLGTAEAAASATTLILTTTAAVAVGGTAFFAVSGDTQAVSSASGGGITWVVDQSSTNGTEVSLIRGHCPAGLASSTAITFTYAAAATNRGATGTSFTGLAANVAVNVGSNSSAGSTAYASSARDPGGAGLIISAAALWTSAGAGSLAVTSPSLLGNELLSGSGVSDKRVDTVYRIVAGAGSVTQAGTWPASSNWVSADASYAEAAAAGGITRTFNAIPFIGTNSRSSPI